MHCFGLILEPVSGCTYNYKYLQVFKCFVTNRSRLIISATRVYALSTLIKVVLLEFFLNGNLKP